MKKRLGRPRSSTAIPVAERVANYRSQMAMDERKRIEVILKAKPMAALQALVDMTGESRSMLLERLLLSELENPSEKTRKLKTGHRLSEGKRRKRAELREALQAARERAAERAGSE